MSHHTGTRSECCCEENATYNQQSIYQSYTTYIGDTINHYGPFYCCTALEDSVIDVSECECGITEFDAGTKRATTTNFTIPKGATIYANFASIELDSGKILAYSRGVAGEGKCPTADSSW